MTAGSSIVEMRCIRLARSTLNAAGLAHSAAQPAHRRSRPGAQGHAPLHGGAHDASERQGGLGDRVRSARAVGFGLETAAAQEPPHPPPDRVEHLRHLRVARPTRRVERKPPGAQEIGSRG
jgi:hypothetical protein